eukprot:358237-Chlamydomonas_euryale.AAC.13
MIRFLIPLVTAFRLGIVSVKCYGARSSRDLPIGAPLPRLGKGQGTGAGRGEGGEGAEEQAMEH